MFAGRTEDKDEEEEEDVVVFVVFVVLVTSGGARELSMWILDSISARELLVLFTSPCDKVDEAEDDVDDPCTDLLIQDSVFCKL